MAIATYDAAVQFLASCIECPICKDICRNPVRPKNCAHRYCLACFKKCFQDKQNKACATCRTPILAVTGRGYTHDELFTSVAQLTPGIDGDDGSDEELDLAALMQKQAEQAANLRKAAQQLRAESGAPIRNNTRVSVPTKATFPKQESAPSRPAAATSGGAPAQSTSAGGSADGHDAEPWASNRRGESSVHRGRKFKIASSSSLEKSGRSNSAPDGGSMHASAGAPPLTSHLSATPISSHDTLNRVPSGKRTYDEMQQQAAAAATSVPAQHAAVWAAADPSIRREAEYVFGPASEGAAEPVYETQTGLQLLHEAATDDAEPGVVEAFVETTSKGTIVLHCPWNGSVADVLELLRREGHADGGHRVIQKQVAEHGAEEQEVEVTNERIGDIAHYGPHLVLTLKERV